MSLETSIEQLAAAITLLASKIGTAPAQTPATTITATAAPKPEAPKPEPKVEKPAPKPEPKAETPAPKPEPKVEAPKVEDPKPEVSVEQILSGDTTPLDQYALLAGPVPAAD